MKEKILKNKKWLIVLAILIILLIVGMMLLLGKNKKESKPDTTTNTNKPKITTNKYTSYIRINPLVKLDIERKCTYSNETDSYDCEEPIVTKTTLVNEDSKEIYKDIDFDKPYDYMDMLYILIDNAQKYGIVFDKVDIYSDWEESKKYIEDNIEKRQDNWNYTFNVTIDEELSLEKIPSEDENKYIVVFNSDGGSFVESQTVKIGGKISKPNNPTKKDYEFVEWQSNGKKYDFNSKVLKNIELKAIWKKKETVQDKITSTKTTTTTKKTIYFTSSTKRTTTTKPLVDDRPTQEKPLGSYKIPSRKPAVCEVSEDLDEDGNPIKSMSEEEVNKYVDLWIDYYGYFYTPGTDNLYIAEGLYLEFDSYGAIYVTDELCNWQYAAPLYQGSPNPYIRNFVNTYVKCGNDCHKIPEYNYKVKCTKTQCWEY